MEDARLSLARGLTNPGDANGIAGLSDLLDFIEHGAPLHLPSSDVAEREKKEKAIGTCKAAVVNAVTEVTGDKKNVDVLWDNLDPSKQGGKFVQKMVSWIKESRESVVTKREGARDDLVICATVAVGNVVRKGTPPNGVMND